jgi:nitrite reductase (NADH) small subunit
VTDAVKNARRYPVCGADELLPGETRIVELAGRSIGIHRTSEQIYAIRNVCPHQGAELCRGVVGSTMLPSDAHTYVVGLQERVIRCPWHGWEFDMQTGRSLFDPEHVRVKTYRVVVEDGTVIVEL